MNKKSRLRMTFFHKMHKKSLMLLLVLSIMCVPIQASLTPAKAFENHQCRLWAMIAHSLPQTIVLNQLVTSPNSMKNLGLFNSDGWGLCYYNDSEPRVLRGEQSANTDPNFVLAAQELAMSKAHTGVCHVRAAASGATNIPNPHPFMRHKNGKWWAFGHNGVLTKATLKSLIGSQYLAENPPTVGDNWSDPSVVDSDLFMLYILKCTEEEGWNVTLGISKAVKSIVQVDSGSMNFFLTDGETIWGFCRGNTLFYYYNEASPRYSVIASQPPEPSQDGWVALSDFNLITLTVDNQPSIVVDITTIPESPTTLASPLLIMILMAVIVLCKKKSGFARS